MGRPVASWRAVSTKAPSYKDLGIPLLERQMRITPADSSHPEGGAEENHGSRSEIVSSLPRETPELPAVSSGPASEPTSSRKEVADLSVLPGLLSQFDTDQDPT